MSAITFAWVIKSPISNANRVEPSVASDLDLYCLPKSFSWDARHKLVKV